MKILKENVMDELELLGYNLTKLGYSIQEISEAEIVVVGEVGELITPITVSFDSIATASIALTTMYSTGELERLQSSCSYAIMALDLVKDFIKEYSDGSGIPEKYWT